MTAARCPFCGAPNDMVTNPADPTRRPSNGDVSVCFRCAGIAVFTGVGLGVRRPTTAEHDEFVADPTIADLVAKVDSARTAQITTRGGVDRFPCGCEMLVTRTTFIFRPHSLLCVVYLYTLAQAKRQGKPIKTVRSDQS